jgi:hypothetical protein
MTKFRQSNLLLQTNFHITFYDENTCIILINNNKIENSLFGPEIIVILKCEKVADLGTPLPTLV